MSITPTTPRGYTSPSAQEPPGLDDARHWETAYRHFDEDAVRATLRDEVVTLEVSLGIGTEAATAYGCDLTRGYIDENAAYYSS